MEQQQPAAGSAAATAADLKLIFCGAGSMAEAIARGLLDGGLARPHNIALTNRSDRARLDALAERYRVVVPADRPDKDRLLREADIVLLCMKPKDAEQALRELAGLVSEHQLIVSVIAGLSIATIERLLGKPVPVVRTMPNTSSTIGLGATGISFNERVTMRQRELASAMFRAVGVTAVVEESLLDAVTGVSGSGPAYVYYMMEAMIAAGEQLGLSAEAARELTVQTVLGAAQMVRASGEPPAELRRKVTSPGGTTQAAIETLEQASVRDAVAAAVARAAERAAEMGAAIERSATK